MTSSARARRAARALGLALLVAAGCRRDAPTVPDRDPGRPAATMTAAAIDQPAVVDRVDAVDRADADLRALAADPPAADLVVLAARLGTIADADAARARSEPPVARAVGDVEHFRVHDIVNNRELDIDARLEIVTEHAWFWVQLDQPFDRDQLARGAREFSDTIYPRLRAVFGSEWSPGVDNDPRVHVLHHEPVPGIAGYFSGADEVTKAVDPNSNALEMFYVNLSVYAPGSADYLGLLAHEFQHMILWHRDYGEPTWVNEGLSEVAPHLVGYPAQFGGAYRRSPDTPLTDWDPTGEGNEAHYAASYLFLAWLHDRFGDPILTAIADAPANGAAGIEAALATVGAPATFDATFLDWVVANRVGKRRAADDPYGYDRPVGDAIEAERLPASGAQQTVAQYGVDYWDATPLAGDGRIELAFEGDLDAALLDDSGRAGNHAWWAGRSDAMHARLWRTFDLSSVETGTPARLTWRTWYDIEEGWDQGYVMASVDGARWAVVATDRTVSADTGGAVGPHVAGATNGWVTDSIDLAAYAGGPVTISFELVTDDAVSLGGWAVDDIALDAIGWSDDVEGDGTGQAAGPGADSWGTAGWHRAPESVPQRWGVQAIVDDGARVVVTRFPVDADGHAAIVVDAVPPDATVTLSVSGLTPLVRRAAGYALSGNPLSGNPLSGSGASSSTSDAYPPPSAASASSAAAYPAPSSPPSSSSGSAPSPSP